MKKPFWIPLLASFGIMILLYVIGYVATIDILVFKISLSYTEISFLPILAGMLTGVTCDLVIRNKSKKAKR